MISQKSTTHPESKFTGKENNPNGFNCSSHDEHPNTFLTGRDGDLYYVNLGKDNVKTWKKATEKSILKNQLLCQNMTEDALLFFSEEIRKKITDKKNKYIYTKDANNDWFYSVGDGPNTKIINNSIPIDMEFLKDLPEQFYTDFFNNLPSEFYSKAYYPKMVLKDNDYIETGLENKFGGKVPFFTEGEEWPLTEDGSPMKFIGQFKDPRESNSMLYRVFIYINEFDDCNIYDIYDIQYVDMSKKQIIIDIPEELEEFEVPFHPLYLIEDYTEQKELISFEDIIEKMNIPNMRFGSIIKSEVSYFGLKKSHDKFLDSYQNHILSPGISIKIGGTPVFCQQNTDITDKNHLLQIPESEYIPLELGDCGIAHIATNDDPEKGKPYYLYWDCY